MHISMTVTNQQIIQVIAAGAILKEQHITEEHKITIQIPV